MPNYNDRHLAIRSLLERVVDRFKENQTTLPALVLALGTGVAAVDRDWVSAGVTGTLCVTIMAIGQLFGRAREHEDKPLLSVAYFTGAFLLFFETAEALMQLIVFFSLVQR